MVIIVSREGQLANRIWHTTSFIANAKENRYRCYHLFFSEYIEYFSESFSKHYNSNPVVFIKNKLLQKFILKTYRFLKKLKLSNSLIFEDINYQESYSKSNTFNLNSSEFITKAKTKVVFISGWFFSDNHNFCKHQNFIKSVFTPNSSYLCSVRKNIENLRATSDLLVAIHIRRSDYRHFNNGIWFYEIGTYYEKMHQLLLLNELKSRRVKFIICSDEELKSEEFKGLDVFCEKKSFIEDFYLLANSNYIIGPPSTFSMWASFYGSIPLFQITFPEQDVAFENFKVWNVV